MTDNKRMYILAELYSRPNATNGKYSACELGLYDLVNIKDIDIFFLENLQMKANLADKIIAQAESQGKNTNDPKVMKELGEVINAKFTPIHRSESVMTSVLVSFYLIAGYGISIGLWGIVFKKSFLMFGLYGAIVGLLVSLLPALVMISQRTRESLREVIMGIGIMVGSIAVIIGIMGLVAWVIRLIFF
jgi:hypothetical protein